MLKNLRLVVPITVLMAVAVGLFLTKGQISEGSCGTSYRKDSNVKIGSHVVKTEVVQSKQEQQKGLSNRQCIGTQQGMLFVFDKPGHYSFWMKDMRFAIDIIWIGADHKVVGIEKKVEPSTYPDSFINKDNSALYVLELQAGQVDALGIDLNTLVNF